MSTYRYIAGEGWADGKEPPANMCKFGTAIDHHTRPTYDFIDRNVTGAPVRIHGKRQWRTFLKDHGMTDEVPSTKREVDANDQYFKKRKREELQKGVSEAMDRAVAEVSKRPYARFGGLSRSEMTQDYSRERMRLERMRGGR